MQVVSGCVLPLTLMLYLERNLRVQHAKRLLAARGVSTAAGSLADDKAYACISILGIALALGVGLWQIVELLDTIYPDGVFPNI